MIYLGIDPSFTKTGVCILDTENKSIKFVAVSPPGTNGDYKATLDRSAYIALNAIRHLDLHKDTRVIIEEPLVTSMMASRLGILSGVVVWSLAFMPNIEKMYSVIPNYVSNLNRNLSKKLGLSKKKTSQHVATKVLEYLEKEKGYEVEIYNDKTNKDGTMRSRVLSHDEAESFLILLTLLRYDGILDRQDINAMISINPKFKLVQEIKQFKGVFEDFEN